jgi:hypothetical protein
MQRSVRILGVLGFTERVHFGFVFLGQGCGSGAVAQPYGMSGDITLCAQLFSSNCDCIKEACINIGIDYHDVP